eukprot:363134-Chlamydomonas_euryale.AAC.3
MSWSKAAATRTARCRCGRRCGSKGKVALVLVGGVGRRRTERGLELWECNAEREALAATNWWGAMSSTFSWSVLP